MNLQKNDYDYKNLKNRGTGSHGDIDDFKIIPYPFDKYQIKVKLTPTNEFIGIVEVGINKDFLSYKQKTTLRGFHDVDEFYRE
ncbi:hypothetical protein C5S39_00480 [Candidatus Methanophagaceae archaeon]|nr:hypothetical protein C5S39_00480 [Methanophagales archaeon]